MKSCKACGGVKPLEAFSPHGIGGWRRGACNSCRNARRMKHRRERRRTDAEYDGWCRLNRQIRAYRLTLDAFHSLLERQDFGCGICGTELGLDGGNVGALIDHCHATGRVRGLLCMRCNTGLGYFQDDGVRMAAAAKYVQRVSA